MSKLIFNHDFTDSLPADAEKDNFPRQVAKACFSFCTPVYLDKKMSDPKLIAYAYEVAEQLGINSEGGFPHELIGLLTGAELFEGMQPFAMRYAGHQFGNWAGQLGDGRAINLGNIPTDRGSFELQLKGAGPTPYSRSGDGYAVLRSSVREFLCSEAMHHLGVPTTRALSLIETGDQILRDMFYDGNAEYEKGAVVCRVAPSFLRFGNFQIHAANEELETLKQLTDFTIQNYFPHLLKTTDAVIDKAVYLAFLQEVTETTCQMIIHWQRVGFVHGVMNTDNMSIHGLTIDYGPYGWLDNYDPEWTPNTTDAQGKRYRFENQPKIAHWNLVQLAQALYPLIEEVEPLQELMNTFPKIYQEGWLKMMTKKLGLAEVQAGDRALCQELNELLSLVETDMPIFYRALAKFDGDLQTIDSLLAESYYQSTELSDEYLSAREQWFKLYAVRLANNFSKQSRTELMNSVNPKYLLRNYLSQVAIDKAEAGDYTEIETLLQIMRNPYAEQPEFEAYASKRPDWARDKAGCSMLSCSS